MFDNRPSLHKRDKNLERAGAFNDLKKISEITNRLVLWSILWFLVGLVLFFPFHVAIFGGVPFVDRLRFIGAFFSGFGAALTGSGDLSFTQWIESFWGWYFKSAKASILPSGDETAIDLWKVCLVLGVWGTAVISPLMLISVRTEGLEKTPNIFGDTRWADERDIAAMSKRDLVGFDGKLFLVGKLKNQLIQMKETLSILLLAPPGTGKTVAFIVPSTVMMDKSCQLLNDQKPELFHMTSGHRATIGPVFQLMWSAQDLPDGGYITEEQAQLIAPALIDLDENGEPMRDQMGAIKVKQMFFPSWNPIGPSSIPAAGPRRDLYIERLVAVLCPDPQGGDKFWTSKARSALIGLIHFLVAKVELGQNPEFPDITENGIPPLWRGKEASFPMFVDWFTDAQSDIEDGDGEDPMRELFRKAVAEARTMDDAYIARYGISIMNRSKAEMTQLMNQPDKTRGSILTTLDEALNPFKNEAVRQRTSNSSFSFTELRGSPKQEPREREEARVKASKERGEAYMPRYKRDEWEPITIYISINAEDAKAFATITGIFVDSANAYLVANGPNAIDDRGNQLGPHDFFFLLDETPTLPKLDTVINGPAVGRSKRVSYAIVGQDFAQIETRYSKAEVETMKSTTAIKVVLSQNNETAARSISQMAGSMTYKKASYGRKESGDPITKFLDLKKEIITSENWEKRDFIDASFVMSMPDGKHIVLVQNFMNRPILSDTPRFFEEPEISKRVYNLRTGLGPKPSLPMPARLMLKAADSGKKAETLRQKAIDIKAALIDPIVAIVVSPKNTSELSYDFDTELFRIAPGESWAIAQVKLTDADRFFETPDAKQVTVTSDPETIKTLTASRKVYVFSDDDFTALNDVIGAGDRIPPELKVAVKTDALEIENETEGNFFTVGYYGTARNDRPNDMSVIDENFGLSWMCEIVNVVHGCAYEYKRITLGAA
ncbi:type IV secretory system conjugative DNA transfer family protein [Loktanella sp. DJP18]|uniref:type IV secretory system conjugative DNA transfer family protein n=1 Tax=Loktanella sp. DJP18 TaxID=3409788 RepID=UPI003BB4B913